MKRRSLKIILLILIALTIFYLRSFNNFFFQDDFFNMKLSQEQNLVDAFNIFKKPALDFFFYRPFSTQLFWTLGISLFGFSPFGYHLISFTFFLASVFLVFKIADQFFSDRKTALLSTFFYGFAASHFYRIFFLSQFQEISLAFFAFLTIHLFYKKSPWTPLFFILSLTTKESAVMVVPFMLVATILDKESRKEYLRLALACLAITAFYLYARFFYFGFAQGEAYQYDFGPRKVANNLFWYGLWSIGLPEAFVNVKIFQLPTILNPELFTKFESWGNITLAAFGLFLATIFYPAMTFIKKIDKKVILLITWFFLFLLPVAFYPFHKFPYSLAVPLLGSSLLLGYISSRFDKKSLFIICLSYFLLSFNAYQFNLSNHWATRKAFSGKMVFAYFQKNYPQKPLNSNIYFRNTTKPLCPDLKDKPKYSLEVSYGIGGVDGLRLLYKDDKLPIYFEDTDRYKHLFSDSLILDSRRFVR